MDTTPGPDREPSTAEEDTSVEGLLGELEDVDAPKAADVADALADRLAAILDENRIDSTDTEEGQP